MNTLLRFQPLAERLDLVSASVAEFARQHPAIAERIDVAPIDPELADTAAFCAHYGIGLEEGANCVVIEGRRGETRTRVACLILGTDRIDVNGTVRRMLDARRASFAPLDDVIADTAMEYGGVTPVGLPAHWPILVDTKVAEGTSLIVGSGLRGAKLRIDGATLAALPGASVVSLRSSSADEQTVD